LTFFKTEKPDFIKPREIFCLLFCWFFKTAFSPHMLQLFPFFHFVMQYCHYLLTLCNKYIYFCSPKKKPEKPIRNFYNHTFYPLTPLTLNYPLLKPNPYLACFGPKSFAGEYPHPYPPWVLNFLIPYRVNGRYILPFLYLQVIIDLNITFFDIVGINWLFPYFAQCVLCKVD